jgi:acyl-CoA thioesterase-1
MLVSVKRHLPILLAGLLGACSSSAPEARAPEHETLPEHATPAPLPSTPAPEDGRKVLVVFGDSISAGYGLDPGLSFPDALQRLIDKEGAAWRVVNLGISGDTTAGGAARIGSALEARPAMVLIELGGNDGLRGIPIAASRANLERMIVAFREAGAQVVLAGMSLPPNYGPDYIRDFENMYKDLATRYKLPLIPFLLADMITQDLRYFQRDGIHPTAEGAEIVAGTVFKKIRPLLN